MAYRQSVYIKAKNILDERRHQANTERDARHSAAVLKCPEIAKIEQEMARCGTSVIKALALGGDSKEYIDSLSKQSLEAQQKRKEALKNAGFPEDYLEVKYTCPKCRDTGFVGGYYCDCYTQLIKDTAKNELAAPSQIKKCTFDLFDVSVYPDIKDEVLGISQKEHMTNVLEYCRDYSKYFTKSADGLIMLGKTGLGKTHLSLAIAGAVIDKGYNVYYGSVPSVMNKLEKEHFGRGNTEENLLEEICECDLLILDDLGAEFSTQFTVAQLYNVLNTRMINNLPTIISTNLTMCEIEEKYSQRVASRIVGNCVPIQFCGRDVRQIINS